MTAIVILNQENDDVIKLIKHLKGCSLFIKGVIKKIENETKKWISW